MTGKRLSTPSTRPKPTGCAPPPRRAAHPPELSQTVEAPGEVPVGIRRLIVHSSSSNGAGIKTRLSGKSPLYLESNCS